jgi:transposase InsO family protein
MDETYIKVAGRWKYLYRAVDVIGTIRRECLDWMIRLSEAHLRSILREWVVHYNSGRPHSALGPGVPGPPAGSAPAPKSDSRRS